ncbi:MAG TPA: hypothetical protein DEP71_01245 [Porphyromonadaceae bacterium]|jgi:hypothetical protein|uniref:Uncharacterized protein n=1 Tax=bioreactor metagenome TaxID=1076179 RepID=A0A644YRJ9_9ZZZZ|nr:hypothetical protein [Petrimonas sp.]MEA4996195.1 hypothetical protein [Petrimonas sp.]MEA5070718.1 hypothetical protein [Petrimonas sp.]HBU45699.1 hypothetical protein [Porphyromonadaceae bacterium]HCB87898.1 hypothetical protein [Porphyromonadaceae bacterium]
MKTLPQIVFTLLFVIIAVSGCDKNERDHLINTEEEIPKIKVSVHYVLNEKEFPDTYSGVYIFFEKKSENFIYWDYNGDGVFSNGKGFITPNKSLIVDSNGMATFELNDDEIKKDFMILVESNNTKIYTLTYFDKYEKGVSLKAIFR